MLMNINLFNNHHYDIDNISEIAKTRLNDFCILTTNIESLNAKLDELLIHITELKKLTLTIV